MLSAAIVRDYYGYNSIVVGDARIRRIHRTELSADKARRLQLKMATERNASLKTGDLIRVTNLQQLNEDKTHNLVSGQDRVRRRVYQQRIIQNQKHSCFVQKAQNSNGLVMGKIDGRGLIRREKTEGLFKGDAAQQEKGLAKRRGSNKIQSKEVQARQALDLREEAVPSYSANQTTGKILNKQDNYLHSYGSVPVATNLAVSHKKGGGQDQNTESGLRDRKRLAITKETEELENTVNEVYILEKDNHIKVSGLDLSQNRDDAMVPSKSFSEIFPKKPSNLQAANLSKSLTPSGCVLLNQDEHILIEEIEEAEKSKLRNASAKKAGSEGRKYNLQQGYFGCKNQELSTAEDVCDKVNVQIREEAGKFLCGSGSNIRITIKSAETADTQQMFVNKIQQAKIPLKEKRQPSICNLLLQSKETDKPDFKSKTLGQLALVSEDVVLNNKAVGGKNSPLAVKQKERQPSFYKQLLPNTNVYPFATVVNKIVQHDTRIGFLYLFVSNTKKTYPGRLKYERYQRLCFLMLKKYLFQKQRMIRSLRGEQSCFTLTGVPLPTEALRCYLNQEDIQQRLLALIKQQREIYGELEKEYHLIAHKYAKDKDKCIKLQITRDIFEKEIMQLLMEQLRRLYGQLHGEEAEVDHIGCMPQRCVQIVEIMFLLSELSGRQVKAFAIVQEAIDNFKRYYLQNYEKLMETTEYFQQL